jgi:hypothetical protein
MPAMLESSKEVTDLKAVDDELKYNQQFFS